MRLRCAKCTRVTAKSQHFHARKNRCCTCMHHESLIASQKLSLAQLLRFALRQPNGKIFRSESLDRVACCASCRGSDIMHRVLSVSRSTHALFENFSPTESSILMEMIPFGDRFPESLNDWGARKLRLSRSVQP